MSKCPIKFIWTLSNANPVFNTLQANPDFFATLQEYIQLDFSNFYHELYIREMEIWGFIFFFIQYAYIPFFLFVFFLLISLIFIFLLFRHIVKTINDF